MIRCLIINILAVAAALVLSPKSSLSQNELKGRISLSGAFALYPMAVRWAYEFRELYPNVKIDISAGGAGKGITDVLNDMVDIGMVSRELYPEEISKGAFAFAVAKDAVVPVISAKNPALNYLMLNGLKPGEAKDIFITGKLKTWNHVGYINLKAPVHVYTRADACGAAEVWADYFGEMQEDLLGSAVFGDPGLTLAVSRDPLGIGYSNMGYTYDLKTKQQIPGIRLVPLDLNENGKIDRDEDFYNSMDDLAIAVSTLKYPSPPARDLYFVVHQKPQSKIVIEFLKWILTEGRKYVKETGFINLPEEKADKGIEKDLLIMLKARLFKDKVARYYMLFITLLFLLFFFIIGFGLLVKALPVVQEKNLWTLLTTSNWRPFKGEFGFASYILSTVYVTFLAIIIALPLSLLTAIYMIEYASPRIRRIFNPVVDLLAGIPSVIYGVWGTLTLIPFISQNLAPHFVDYSTGYSVLAGGVVLAIMIIPLIISILMEVFSSIPREMREASLSLGATKWQTVKKVIIRKSFPGIVAAIVLAISRAFGETIAVLMVCGNFTQIPKSVFDACYPLPALIANNYGEMMSVPRYESALMLAAFLLFIIIVVFNVFSRLVLVQIDKRYHL